MLTINQVITRTGLSRYLLDVVYDFHSHSLLKELQEETRVVPKRRQPLTHVVCNNPSKIPSVTNDTEIKTMVAKRENDLRSVYGNMSEKKDCLLISEFLGWAQTQGGHFVYVYYTGPEKNRLTGGLQRVENWKLVSKDHLSLFHSRIGRGDMSSYLCMNSTDVTESVDGIGNLALDIRYIAKKWFHANEQHYPLLREAMHLFVPQSLNYVTALHSYHSTKLSIFEQELCYDENYLTESVDLLLSSSEL